MRLEIIKIDMDKEIEVYPKLMCSFNKQTIIFVTSKNEGDCDYDSLTGMVIYTFNDFEKIGTYSKSWCASAFFNYYGSINIHSLSKGIIEGYKL